MRFGLGSSLMLDNVYFSYDHGDQDHGQLWWYDEYNLNLGEAISPAQSKNGYQDFQNDLWWRDYEKGIALVNSDSKIQKVELGAEYEKLLGTQDTQINDGSIVSSVSIPARDGLLMLKTTQTVNSIPFNNGDFLRFYFLNGSRARNGYFSFDEEFSGGEQIYRGNLNGEGEDELILVRGYKFDIFDSLGRIWQSFYPFGGGFRGEMRVSVGRLYGSPNDQIVLSSNQNGEIYLMNYHGKIIVRDFYPLGKGYQGGFTSAIRRIPGKFFGEVVLGTADGRVLILDHELKNIKRSFRPYAGYYGKIEVAAGNLDGKDGDEIVVSDDLGIKQIKVFSVEEDLVSEFDLDLFFGAKNRSLYASDVNFDGKDEIVVLDGV